MGVEQFVLTATAVEGVPKLMKILPLGLVKSRKGAFTVDEEAYEAMKAYHKERGIDIVCDYEHQTLNGVQAPAAGWATELLLKEDGIYANMQWNDRAKSYLENREYRYVSPVVDVRLSDRKAIHLTSIALTNTPAIDHMEAIVNSMNTDTGGQTNMEFIKALAKSLGLGEDATEAQILEAVTAVIKKAEGTQGESQDSQVVANSAVLTALSLKDDATEADVLGAISGMKNTPVSTLTEMVALKAQVEKLSKKLSEQDAGSLVEKAITSGKITPAMKGWAEEMALKDPAAFKQFVEVAPEAVNLDEIGTSTGSGKRTTQTEQSVNSMLGVTEEDIEKFGGDQ